MHAAVSHCVGTMQWVKNFHRDSQTKREREREKGCKCAISTKFVSIAEEIGIVLPAAEYPECGTTTSKRAMFYVTAWDTAKGLKHLKC